MHSNGREKCCNAEDAKKYLDQTMKTSQLYYDNDLKAEFRTRHEHWGAPC